MKKIKFLKPNISTGLQKIKLENKNGFMLTYKPYTICDLPDKFGTDEITDWFNYKGLTYIIEE
jgi:hypothetical protein|tara:strand:- start:98 stop:286 length:189 start_codon:yes stop_codon:yes gene_type:complete